MNLGNIAGDDNQSHYTVRKGSSHTGEMTCYQPNHKHKPPKDIGGNSLQHTQAITHSSSSCSSRSSRVSISTSSSPFIGPGAWASFTSIINSEGSTGFTAKAGMEALGLGAGGGREGRTVGGTLGGSDSTGGKATGVGRAVLAMRPGGGWGRAEAATLTWRGSWGAWTWSEPSGSLGTSAILLYTRAGRAGRRLGSGGGREWRIHTTEDSIWKHFKMVVP